MSILKKREPLLPTAPTPEEVAAFAPPRTKRMAEAYATALQHVHDLEDEMNATKKALGDAGGRIAYLEETLTAGDAEMVSLRAENADLREQLTIVKERGEIIASLVLDLLDRTRRLTIDDVQARRRLAEQQGLVAIEKAVQDIKQENEDDNAKA